MKHEFNFFYFQFDPETIQEAREWIDRTANQYGFMSSDDMLKQLTEKLPMLEGGLGMLAKVNFIQVI